MEETSFGKAAPDDGMVFPCPGSETLSGAETGFPEDSAVFLCAGLDIRAKIKQNDEKTKPAEQFPKDGSPTKRFTDGSRTKSGFRTNRTLRERRIQVLRKSQDPILAKKLTFCQRKKDSLAKKMTKSAILSVAEKGMAPDFTKILRTKPR